jgi:hypothetical protein
VELEPPEGVEPPLASYVTVNAFAVHCANKVVFAAIDHVDEPPAVNEVPLPFAAVFQPANVYPARVNEPALAVVNDEPNVALPLDGGEPPVLELPSYVTVYEFAVHTG